MSVEFRARGEQTELLTRTDFPASHGPAPYRLGWEGGLEKFEALFAGSGIEAWATNPVTIARPPAEVFAFLADGANHRQWRSGACSSQIR